MNEDLVESVCVVYGSDERLVLDLKDFDWFDPVEVLVQVGFVFGQCS